MSENPRPEEWAHPASTKITRRRRGRWCSVVLALAEVWEVAQAGRSRGLAHTCRTMLQARSQTKVGDRLTRRSAPAMRRVSGAGVPAEAAPARRRLCCERSHASFRAWSVPTKFCRGQARLVGANVGTRCTCTKRGSSAARARLGGGARPGAPGLIVYTILR